MHRWTEKAEVGLVFWFIDIKFLQHFDITEHCVTNTGRSSSCWRQTNLSKENCSVACPNCHCKERECLVQKRSSSKPKKRWTTLARSNKKRKKKIWRIWKERIAWWQKSSTRWAERVCVCETLLIPITSYSRICNEMFWRETWTYRIQLTWSPSSF